MALICHLVYKKNDLFILQKKINQLITNGLIFNCFSIILRKSPFVNHKKPVIARSQSDEVASSSR